MPRALRILPGNHVYHVLNRGNGRRQIFDNKAEFSGFRALLSEAAHRTSVRVCAFCLMGNHWHLVLWPREDGAVSALVHWLCTSHALQRRRDHSTESGHLYQGRFRCFAVENTAYYFRVVRYVEDNAHRAGLVASAQDWPWSSAAERLRSSDLVVPGPLPLPENWLGLVNTAFDADILRDIRVSARRGRPYGSSEWVDRTADALGLSQKLRGTGRPSSPAEAERYVKMRLA